MNIEYSNLVDRIRLTGSYVEQLARIESNMSDDLEENNIDIIVQEKLNKCINEINAIYVATPDTTKNGRLFLDDELKENKIEELEKNIAWLIELMVDVHFNGGAMEPEQNEEFDRLNDKYNIRSNNNE